MRTHACTRRTLLAAAAALCAPACAAPRRPPSPDWRRLLLPPVAPPGKLPADWPVAALAPGTHFRPGGQICGFGYLSTTVDELVREADLVASGEVVAHDGSFHAPEPFQYTTYYLRVTGYLKDRSGARCSYLKVLGRGGFLGGQPDAAEQRPEEPEWPPYLETGKRYLLYLTPNHGIEGGGQGTTSHPIGRRDEYWVCGMGKNGLWWEKAGDLIGFVEPEYHYSLPGRRGPFALAEALRRVQEAVRRERLGLSGGTPSW